LNLKDHDFIVQQRGGVSETMRWQVYADVTEDCLCNTAYLEQQRARLLAIGREAGVSLSEATTEEALDRLEEVLSRPPIHVPVLDVEFPEGVAFWAFSLLTMVILASMRSSLWTVLAAAKPTVTEPWPMLDVRTRLDAFIANAGIGFVLLCPWIVAACHLVFLGERYWNEHVGASLVGTFLPFCFACAIGAISGRLGLSCTGSLLRLRRQRSNELLDLFGVQRK